MMNNMMNNNNFNNNNFNNSANAMDNEFLDWDGSFVAEESQFTTLKDGDYPFEVTKIERKMYDGNSQKIPNGAPYAEVSLRFNGGEQGNTTVTERLYLLKSLAWKLTEFFGSIGQAPVVGQPFKPNWNTVVGSHGVATLTIHKYTSRDGQERSNNQVKKFKKGGQAPQQAPQQQMPQQQAPQGYQQPQQPVQQQQQPVQPQQAPQQQMPNNDFFPGAF